eukprot:3911547-Pyramimonas_sp.AAC.1
MGRVSAARPLARRWRSRNWYPLGPASRTSAKKESSCQCATAASTAPCPASPTTCAENARHKKR